MELLRNIKKKLIVKGFKQQEYAKYFDICTFVSSITSIQMLITIINIKKKINTLNRYKNSF